MAVSVSKKNFRQFCPVFLWRNHTDGGIYWWRVVTSKNQVYKIILNPECGCYTEVKKGQAEMVADLVNFPSSPKSQYPSGVTYRVNTLLINENSVKSILLTFNAGVDAINTRAVFRILMFDNAALEYYLRFIGSHVPTLRNPLRSERSFSSALLFFGGWSIKIKYKPLGAGHKFCGQIIRFIGSEFGHKHELNHPD